jgi:hypothetical protein
MIDKGYQVHLDRVVFLGEHGCTGLATVVLFNDLDRVSQSEPVCDWRVSIARPRHRSLAFDQSHPGGDE